MFELALRRSLAGRVLGGIFWLGLPVLLLLRLAKPFQSVIYISWEPLSAESNTIQSGLPTLLAELLYSYSTTLLAVAVLLVSAFVWRQVRLKRRARTPVWLPV